MALGLSSSFFYLSLPASLSSSLGMKDASSYTLWVNIALVRFKEASVEREKREKRLGWKERGIFPESIFNRLTIFLIVPPSLPNSRDKQLT